MQKSKSQRNKVYVAVSILLVLILAFAGWFLFLKPSDDTVGLVNAKELSSLQRTTSSEINTSRLSNDIVPPTNKWFSGIALQEEPKAVFPLPLSFKPTDTGFTFGVPDIDVSANSISGNFSNDMSVAIDARNYVITRYDELTVDLTYFDASGAQLMTVTIGSGLPYVFIAANKATTISLENSNPSDFDLASATDASVKVNDSVYGLKVFDGDGKITASTEGTFVELEAGTSLSFYVKPENQNAEIVSKLAANKVVSGAVSYEEKDGQSLTSLTYKTANNEPTIAAVLPHYKLQSAPADVTFETIYGKLNTSSAAQIQYSVPITAVTDSLSLKSLSDDEKAALVAQLRLDMKATRFDASDTYAAGKSLYRASQLIMLANELDEAEIRTTLVRMVHNELTTWFDAPNGRTEKVFYYDVTARGLIGQAPAYGSEGFNDHHFQYGYFVYAAAVVAKFDDTFLKNYQDRVNLVVADIANTQQTKDFPLRRGFDPYAGHSWASGSSPFDSGNNHESSSEAITAWVGVSLWSDVSQNAALNKQMSWMLSNEIASAKAYWLSTDYLPTNGGDNYTHSLVPLNWGGKRDYATWFNDAPSAKLAIQLIPMSPTALTYLDSLSEVSIEAQLLESPLDRSDVVLGDYILMYKKLSNAGLTLNEIKAIDTRAIDTANSRSYMMAWALADK